MKPEAQTEAAMNRIWWAAAGVATGIGLIQPAWG